jgi:hypothetical protein
MMIFEGFNLNYVTLLLHFTTFRMSHQSVESSPKSRDEKKK